MVEMQTINMMFIKCCDQSLQRTGKLWGALEYNHVVTLQAAPSAKHNII